MASEKGQTKRQNQPKCPKRCQPQKMLQPKVDIGPILHIFTFEVFFLFQGELHGVPIASTTKG